MKRMIWLVLIMMLPIVSAQMFIQSNGGETSSGGFFAVIKGFFGLTDGISCNPLIRYNATECSYGTNSTQNVTSYDANWNTCCKVGGTCYLDDSISTNQTYLQDDVPCGEKPMELVAIAIFLIGGMFWLIYTANNLNTKTEQGEAIPFNTLIKMVMYSLAGFMFFIILQTAYAISQAAGLSQLINSNLAVTYKVGLWFFAIIGALILFGLLINVIYLMVNSLNERKAR